MAKETGILNTLKRSGTEWLLPALAVSTVFVMLVPLPGYAIDILLALSMTASVLVLLCAVQVLKPVQFSVFPSLLLLLTLFRLSLNIASSRRILLHGSEGASAAGRVIEAFGHFVIGGNYIVGFVLFLALIAIQFMVVSHGAVRTAEVTARFTLDAMPGKQMAIDADLNAGLINEEQARTRRQQIARDAEFYGAMDGAARFNQRDSLATILITAINIVAGFLIGVFQQGVPFQEALKTYTTLTVGDGLVTLIPSLLVSVAGAMVLTRASSESTLSKDLTGQLFGKSRPLWMAGGVMLLLSLIPGLPKLSFVLMAGVMVFLARRVKSEEAVAAAATAAEGKKPATGAVPAGDPLDNLLKLDELTLEVGYGLVRLVDVKQGGHLLSKVKSLRKHLATQLGFLAPPIHITDNISLKENEYVVYLRGVEIARWQMRRDCLLAINSNPNAPALAGTETREPAFNVAAKWIAADLQAQALSMGYTVVDQTSVLATHLGELVKQNAHELLTRQETKRMLDHIGESHPKLLDELVPKLLTLGEVQRVLQQLLREQVSIRDLGTILETLAETAPMTKNSVLLVEAVRHSLGRALVHPLLSEQGDLKVVTVAASIEEECNRAINPQQNGLMSSVTPTNTARHILESLRKLFGDQLMTAPPVLLCSSPGRFYLRRLLEPFLPRIVVLAPTEIPPVTPVQSIGALQ